MFSVFLVLLKAGTSREMTNILVTPHTTSFKINYTFTNQVWAGLAQSCH